MILFFFFRSTKAQMDGHEKTLSFLGLVNEIDKYYVILMLR